MNDIEQLKSIYKKYSKSTEQIAEEFIEELKRDSETYNDVNKKIASIKREILFDNREDNQMFIKFIDYIEQLLEKEKNSLTPKNKGNEFKLVINGEEIAEKVINNQTKQDIDKAYADIDLFKKGGR